MGLGKHNIQYRSQVDLTECQPLRAERVGLKGGRWAGSWAERLAARTVKGPSCWDVTGCRVGNGYGQIGGPRINGRQERKYAHVVAWELANGGPVPSGLVVMHACDNPRCVNPSHLSVGTQAQNIHDAIHKGRWNAFGVQKLNAAQVYEIRALASSGVRQKAIAAQFDIARNTVSQIVAGLTWAHLDRIEHPFNLNNVERVRTVPLQVRGDLVLGKGTVRHVA